MRNLAIFTKYQLRLLVADYKFTLLGFFVPILSFLIFSNVLSGQNYGGTVNIVNYLLPAFVTIIIINAVLVLFGEYFVFYLESEGLLKYKLLGIPEYITTLSIYLSTLIFQIIASIGLIAVSTFSLDVSVAIPYKNFISVIAAIVIINMFQLAIVLFLSSFIRKGTAYHAVTIILFNYQMFVGGLTFPPELFPNFLKIVLFYLNPIYYGLILMRGVWVDHKSILDFPKEIIILVSVSVVLVLLGSVIRKRSLS